MAGFYQAFNSIRTTEPDPATLLSNLRALDSTAGVRHDPGSSIYVIKKSSEHGYNKRSKLERKHLYGGFIAQDVKKLIPIAVGYDQNKYLTLSDRPILGAAVNAIKELNLRLEKLERKVA